VTLSTRQSSSWARKPLTFTVIHPSVSRQRPRLNVAPRDSFALLTTHQSPKNLDGSLRSAAWAVAASSVAASAKLDVRIGQPPSYEPRIEQDPTPSRAFQTLTRRSAATLPMLSTPRHARTAAELRPPDVFLLMVSSSDPPYSAFILWCSPQSSPSLSWGGLRRKQRWQ